MRRLYNYIPSNELVHCNAVQWVPEMTSMQIPSCMIYAMGAAKCNRCTKRETRTTGVLTRKSTHNRCSGQIWCNRCTKSLTNKRH